MKSEIQDFIDRHLNFTAAEIMLKASKFPEWDMKAIAHQLSGKQIAKKKLPSWYKNNDILYPIRLSMEQCSSEATAVYKSNLINSGRGIDLTGGFGVDAYFMAKTLDSHIYCEQNEVLATMVAHNFKVFKNKCKVFIGNGVYKLR